MKRLFIFLLAIVSLSCSNNDDKEEKVDIKGVLMSQQWTAKDTITFVAVPHPDEPFVRYIEESHTLHFDDTSFTWDIEIKDVYTDTVIEKVITHTGSYSTENRVAELTGDAIHYYASVDLEELLSIPDFLNSAEATVKLTFEKEK